MIGVRAPAQFAADEGKITLGASHHRQLKLHVGNRDLAEILMRKGKEVEFILAPQAQRHGHARRHHHFPRRDDVVRSAQDPIPTRITRRPSPVFPRHFNLQRPEIEKEIFPAAAAAEKQPNQQPIKGTIETRKCGRPVF